MRKVFGCKELERIFKISKCKAMQAHAYNHFVNERRTNPYVFSVVGGCGHLPAPPIYFLGLYIDAFTCTYTHTLSCMLACHARASCLWAWPTQLCVYCGSVSAMYMFACCLYVHRYSINDVDCIRSHFWTQAVVRVERATQERKLSGTHTCTAAYTAAHSTLILPWHHRRPN